MIQIILAIAFLAMIVTPAVIAATSGKKETEIEQDELDMHVPGAEALSPAARRQMAARKSAQNVPVVAATLPMHGTLGMANR
ncbi:hypothetical protein [Silvibacterium sp.]|uniref:hypothetical protein n=1 Tax=Silvibacterium sp. TaxID=1964179 RepID=UPI0039E2780C